MGALWAACAYSNDDDPFDTLLYAQTRLGEYFRLRQ